jgi:uncharacterized protein (DUF488 family)
LSVAPGGRGRLFTVGHGTRPLDELVALLAEHGITQLVDVRHYPRSRRNPQFNLEALAAELPRQGITVVWLGEDLGGFRPGGYQAWMTSAAFQRGLAQLEQLAEGQVTAIMCAETVWFRCHRRFIARQLVAHGYRVTHLLQVGKEGYEERSPIPAQFALSANSA